MRDDTLVAEAPDHPAEDGWQAALRAAWLRYSLPVTIVVALLALAEQLHLWSAFGRKFLSQDHTLIWYAARDWGQLDFHEPSFYGQAYGGTFEGIPVEVGRWLGVGPLASLSLLLAFLAVGGWFLLAWAGRARGHRFLALLAVAAPILISTNYTALEAFYVAAVGRFLGLLGASLLLARGERRAYLFAGTAVGIFGIVLDYQAALILVPVLTYVVLSTGQRARALATIAVAAIPGVAWFAFNSWFYDSHPEHRLFELSVIPKFAIFGRSLEASSKWWGLFEPELWRWWIVPLVISAGGLLVVLWTRRARFVLPALALLVVWLFALASPRADHAEELIAATGLLRRERLILVLPAGLWFLALLMVESGAVRRLSRFVPVIAGVLLVFVAGSALERVVTFGADIQTLAFTARGPGVLQVLDQDKVFRQCDEQLRVARVAGVSLIFYPDAFTLAYACGALGYGDIETVTAVDRRTWIVRAEDRRERDGLMVVGGPKGLCRQARVRNAVISCRTLQSRTPGDQSMTIIKFEPSTAFDLLHRIGVGLRPATRGCNAVLTADGWKCTRHASKE